MPAAAIEQPAISNQKPSIDLELSTPAFSGPLALLLELIERRKLPITTISIAEVADQYLERMRLLVGIDPEILADFLVIAARLLLLKSRELLPSSPVETEEPDVAAELQQRLLEYRLFREAAEQLRQLEEAGKRSYTPQLPAEPIAGPEPPLEPIPAETLRAAMVRMLKALNPKPVALVLRPQISVEERIEYIVSYMSTRPSVAFSDVAGGTVHEIVASFLALLELLRRGILSAEQDAPFAEIRLSLVPRDTFSADIAANLVTV